MFKKVILGMIAFMVVSGQMFGALAQDENEYPASQVPRIKGESVYATPSPGRVGGPVVNHPELLTPQHLKEEAKAAKEYCRTHDCSTVPKYVPGGQQSIEQAMRAFNSSHDGFGEGVADPSDTTECETDPAHPTGPDIRYRASDHSRVYPGTPGEN